MAFLSRLVKGCTAGGLFVGCSLDSSGGSSQFRIAGNLLQGYQLVGAGGTGVEGIDRNTVFVVGLVLVFDDLFHESNGSQLSSFHTVIGHRTGHIQHNHNVDLRTGGVRNAGHGQLDLSNTGFGEVTHSGSGLIEADSTLVGVLGEVVGAITGGGMLRGGNIEVNAGSIALAIDLDGCSYIECAIHTLQRHNTVFINGSDAVVFLGDVPGHSGSIGVGTCAGDLIDQCAQIDSLVFLNALNGNGGVGDILAILLNGQLIVRSGSNDFDVVGSGLAGNGIADLDQRLAVLTGEGNGIAGDTLDDTVGITVLNLSIGNISVGDLGGSATIGSEGHGAAQSHSATIGNDLLDFSLLGSDCICAISGSSNRTFFVEVDTGRIAGRRRCRPTIIVSQIIGVFATIATIQLVTI